MEVKSYNTVRAHAVIPLKDLLPLGLPLSMFIDPVNLCNFRCTFCPTGDFELLGQFKRPKGSMKYDLYCKIIDDLQLMCKTNNKRLHRLHLYKDGEPLLNKNLGKMIVYAKEKEVSDSVETTTNGALLTQEKAREVIECDLDVIRISVEHVSDSGYKKVTQTYDSYETILRNVEFLFHEKERLNSSLQVFTKIVDMNLSDEDKEKFRKDFSPISDFINIDQLMGWSMSEAEDWKQGNTVSTGMDGVTTLKTRKVCPEPFSKLAVNFDGTVSICCVDWTHGTVVGDLKTQSLLEVWNGEALNKFRLLHLNGKRSQIEACSKCDYLNGLPEYSMIDNEAERLLKIYSNGQ